MTKLVYLNYTELEFDTDTGKTRILKSWTAPTKNRAVKKPVKEIRMGEMNEVLI